MNTDRDFAAEYLAARITVWTATTANDRADAEAAAEAILDAADAADSDLYRHVFDIDNAARKIA